MSYEIDPLIIRLYIFLEDGDWNKAEEYCERILDISPKNVDAYIGKLMIDLKIHQIQDIATCGKAFEKNPNYKRIIQFGDESIKERFESYLLERSIRQNQIKHQREAGVERVKEKSIKIFPIIIVFIIVVGCFLYFCIPRKKENNHVEINKEKNYVMYRDMNIKLPYSEDFSVTVKDDTIVLSQGFDLTINEFLKYVYAPKGKQFGTTNSYASSNGDSSFVIRDYITVQTQYYYDGPYSSETLDLIFCGYGKNYKAKYISKSGAVPIKTGNFATRENNWRNDIYFELGKETVLIGRYTDSTEVKIKVIKR